MLCKEIDSSPVSQDAMNQSHERSVLEVLRTPDTGAIEPVLYSSCEFVKWDRTPPRKVHFAGIHFCIRKSFRNFVPVAARLCQVAQHQTLCNMSFAASSVLQRLL